MKKILSIALVYLILSHNAIAAIYLKDHTISGILATNVTHIDMQNGVVAYGKQNYTPSLSIGGSVFYKSQYFLNFQTNRLVNQSIEREGRIGSHVVGISNKLIIDSFSVGKLYNKISFYGTVARLDGVQKIESSLLYRETRVIDTVFGVGAGYRILPIAVINVTYIFGSNKMNFSNAFTVGLNIYF